MLSILCTGGLGFIGSHLVDALVELGHNVTVLDNISTGQLENLNKDAKLIIGDISDTTLVETIFNDNYFDVVFHLAAQINLRESIHKPHLDCLTNVGGSLNIIQQCIKHNVKFIFSSTGGAIYDGTQPLPWTESSLANPASPYGLAKLTVEKYLDVLGKIYGLSWTALRYSNVYGPRQNAKGEAGVISIFINQALKNEPLNFFGDGHQTRDYIYVDDVVKANILALCNIPGIYNVSTNQQYSLHDIVDKLKVKLNKDLPIKYHDAIVGEISHTRLSYSKLAKYSWNPETSLDDGLDLTIKYFTEKKDKL